MTAVGVIDPTRIAQLASLRRFDEAEALAVEAIAEVPQDADLHGLRSLILMRLGRLPEALESAERAIGLDHTNADNHCRRGSALAALGRDDEAEESFDAAVSLAPESLVVHVTVAEGLLGDPRSRSGPHRSRILAKVKESVDALLTFAPESSLSHLMAAQLHLATGNAIEARAAAKRSLTITPDQPSAHQILGIAEQSLGRNREAGDAYVSAGKVDPTSSSSGELLDDLGSSLGKIVAPVGLGAFLLFRATARAGARGAESAGAPIGLILVVVVVAMVLFFVLREQPSPKYEEDLSQLNPEARSIIEQRREYL